MYNFKIRKIFLNEEKEKRLLVEFLKKFELHLDSFITNYFGIYDQEKLIGGGGIYANTLRSIAIEKEYQGSNAIEILMSKLTEELYDQDINDIFIITKNDSAQSFKNMGFYNIISTKEITLLENSSYNIKRFCNQLQGKYYSGNNGALVVNCNPFTYGHKFLIQNALLDCDHLYIFVVSEDMSAFPFDVRYKLVTEGVKDLENITIIPGGNYIISSSTFPSYFLKEDQVLSEINASLDAEIFARIIAPTLGIKKRFVGNEPYCKTTAIYNETLKKTLENLGIELKVIQRKEINKVPISASLVRKYIKKGLYNELEKLIPNSTLNFLKDKKNINILKKIHKNLNDYS